MVLVPWCELSEMGIKVKEIGNNSSGLNSRYFNIHYVNLNIRFRVLPLTRDKTTRDKNIRTMFVLSLHNHSILCTVVIQVHLVIWSRSISIAPLRSFSSIANLSLTCKLLILLYGI